MAEAPAEAFQRRVMARARRIGCFDADDYIAMHADLAATEPYEHFADFGVWEGRRCVAPERFLGRLAEAAAEAAIDAAGAASWEQGYRRSLDSRPTIVLPDLPDRRDLATARALATALEYVGVPSPTGPGAWRDRGATPVVVQPAKTLFRNGRKDGDFRALAASVIVARAAPDDDGFPGELPFMLGAAGVIATSAETAALLRQAGVPSAWIRAPVADKIEPAPTAHPLYAGLGRRVQGSAPRAPWRDRPIDVLAIQPMTGARRRAWEPLAEPLQAFRTILYPAPHDASDLAAETALRGYLLDRSKIVLNLHPADGGALPTMLAEEAAIAGVALVSEPSRRHPIMRPSAHYFEAGPRRLGALVDELLTTSQGREAAQKAVRRNRALWIAQTDPEIDGLALVNLLADAAELAE